MREIKFRGKRLDNDEWVYFNLYGAYVDENGNEISPKRFIRDCGFKVDADTVGQYTGLKDKNGKEIYEGDIVRYVSSGDLVNHLVVKWNSLDACFYFGWVRTNYAMQGEVIGNIYENPELINS